MNYGIPGGWIINPKREVERVPREPTIGVIDPGDNFMDFVRSDFIPVWIIPLEYDTLEIITKDGHISISDRVCTNDKR